MGVWLYFWIRRGIRGISFCCLAEWQVDHADGTELQSNSAIHLNISNTYVLISYPTGNDLTQPRKNWLSSFLQKLEAVLYSPALTFGSPSPRLASLAYRPACLASLAYRPA